MKRQNFNFNNSNANTAKTKKNEKVKHHVIGEKKELKLSKMNSKNNVKPNKIVMMF